MCVGRYSEYLVTRAIRTQSRPRCFDSFDAHADVETRDPWGVSVHGSRGTILAREGLMLQVKQRRINRAQNQAGQGTCLPVCIRLLRHPVLTVREIGINTICHRGEAPAHLTLIKWPHLCCVLVRGPLPILSVDAVSS